MPLGNCDSAVQDFDAVLDLDPDKASALRDRGLALAPWADSTKPLGTTSGPWDWNPTTPSLRPSGAARPGDPGLHQGHQA